MSHSNRGLATALAICLLASVATQIFYVAVVSNAGPDTILRPITWMTEAAIFSLAAVVAMAWVVRSPVPLAGSAILLASVLNAIQVGMGLAMFGPAAQAGDPQVMRTVLAGAFFLFFQAKALLGLAAIGVGLAAFRAGIAGRIVGALAILGGIAAAILNLLAMAQGMGDSTTFAAGASGTVATALLAVGLLMVPAQEKTG